MNFARHAVEAVVVAAKKTIIDANVCSINSLSSIRTMLIVATGGLSKQVLREAIVCVGELEEKMQLREETFEPAEELEKHVLREALKPARELEKKPRCSEMHLQGSLKNKCSQKHWSAKAPM